MNTNISTQTKFLFNKTKLIIALIASLYFAYYCFSSTEWHFIDNVNLLIHEAGHVIFIFFGEFMNILGGSLFQILFPLVFVIYFYRNRDYFSASLLLFWVGQNFINVSVYASDAILMQLPLLGGDSSIHDWNYLLQKLGVIRHTDVIGQSIYIIGVVVIVLAIYFSFYFALNSEENIA